MTYAPGVRLPRYNLEMSQILATSEMVRTFIFSRWYQISPVLLEPAQSRFSLRLGCCTRLLTTKNSRSGPSYWSIQNQTQNLCTCPPGHAYAAWRNKLWCGYCWPNVTRLFLNILVTETRAMVGLLYSPVKKPEALCDASRISRVHIGSQVTHSTSQKQIQYSTAHPKVF